MTGAGLVATPRRRALTVVAVVLAGLSVLGAGGLRDSLIYYRTPAEVAATPPPPGERFRLAGLVVGGSLHRSADTVVFVLTDGVQEVRVEHSGQTPQLLREGSGAVVEGTLSGGTFRSDLVMVKHSNEYRPPTVAPELAPELAPDLATAP